MKSNLNPPAYEKVQDMHNCITFLQRDCAIVVQLYPTRYNEDYCTFGEGGCYLRPRPRSQPHPLDRRISTHLSGLEVRRWDGCLASRWVWVLPRQIESSFQHDLSCHMNVLFIYHNLSVTPIYIQFLPSRTRVSFRICKVKLDSLTRVLI